MSELRFRTYAPPPEPTLDELALPRLRRFAVAKCRCGLDWPQDDPINVARRRYDAGTHEMVQSRNGSWVVLYSIPRKRPTARRCYFGEIV